MDGMRAALLPLILIAFAAGQEKSPDELFILQIGERRYEVIGGQAIELQIHGKKTAVKVTPMPYRQLNTKWFSFRFPRNHVYSYDGGAELAGQQIWHIEHDTSFIQIIQSIAETEKEALDLYLEELKGDGIKRTPMTLVLDEAEWRGALIDDTSDEDIAQRTFVLTRKTGGKIWVLYVFDVPDEKGGMSKELQPAYELFRKTFKMR